MVQLFAQNGMPPQTLGPQAMPQGMQVAPYQPPPVQGGFDASKMAQALQPKDATNNLMNQSQPSTNDQWAQFLASYGSAQPQMTTPQSQMMPWQGGTFGTGGGGYGG